jgi:hypothetical protein
MPEFQIAPVLPNNEHLNEISSLNASEKSRQQVTQQETPTTGRQTPSAVKPYVLIRKLPNIPIASVLQTTDIFTRFLHWTPQKKVGNKFPSNKLLAMNTKPPQPLPPMLTRQSCRNFKSLPFSKKWMFERDFSTERLREKSATSSSAKIS